MRLLLALVKAGANLQLRRSRGGRPLVLAKARGYAEMVKMPGAAGPR
jgi:hypothetical protein